MSNEGHPRAPSKERQPLGRSVFIDLAEGITEQQVQAMTRALARILVAQALVEHGIRPANDNE